MKITRDDVIKAIDTESLVPNQWVEGLTNPACRVCAVGAVLRNAGLDNGDIVKQAEVVTRGQYAPSYGSLPKILKDGNYMGALSIQFERLCVQAPLEVRDVDGEILSWYLDRVVKQSLRSWVLSKFPEGVIYED